MVRHAARYLSGAKVSLVLRVVSLMGRGPSCWRHAAGLPELIQTNDSLFQAQPPAREAGVPLEATFGGTHLELLTTCGNELPSRASFQRLLASHSVNQQSARLCHDGGADT
jgi:hypothetical protein